MDEDITLQEILRRLAEENPNIYPVTPSWMSPFTRGGIGLKEKDFANLRNYVPDDREMYKPHYEGQNVRGPFASRPGIVTNQADTKRNPHAGEDDYLNQLMMAALMAGGKKGKMGQLAGAAGGGISFGDSWSMRAPWEKDYRYL